MQFEVIRKNHKKEVMIGVVAIILIAVVLLVRNSFAKYQTTKNMKIVEGTINYTIPDFKVMAMYKNDGEGDIPVDTMPESGYTINTEKSYCTTDNVNKVYNKIYTDESGQHIITGLDKNSKCYIYFDTHKINGSTELLKTLTINNETPNFNLATAINEGTYKMTDESGEYSYYFRGAVTNNYVKFANKYWRIVRINGDGTIRLIYDGDTPRANGENITLERSEFNSSGCSDGTCAGFTYTKDGVELESKMLQSLNIWYENNLLDYTDKIDINAGFCGDRSYGYSDQYGTYFSPWQRLLKTHMPSLNCTSSDFYTLSNSNKGNKKLTYPIGLITADEAVMAGQIFQRYNTPCDSNSNYICINSTFWSMTPAVISPNCHVIYVSSSMVDNNYPNISLGIRPVINLKKDTVLMGYGTFQSPYIVEGGN